MGNKQKVGVGKKKVLVSGCGLALMVVCRLLLSSPPSSSSSGCCCCCCYTVATFVLLLSWLHPKIAILLAPGESTTKYTPLSV